MRIDSLGIGPRPQGPGRRGRRSRARPGRKAVACALALALLPIASCAPADPPRIVFAGTFTGAPSAVALSIACRDGALLAVEDINAKGGVGGRPLELVVIDDMGDPATAPDRDIAALRKAKARVLVGHMTSSFKAVMLALDARKEWLLITPTIAAAELEKEDDLILRALVASEQNQGRALGALARRLSLGSPRVLITEQNMAFQAKVADSFDEAFGAPAPRSALSAKPDYAALAAEAAKGADSIVILSGSVDVVGMAIQLRKAGWKGQLLGVSQGMTGETLEQGGAAVEGMRFLGIPQNDSSDPEFRAFAARYVARFGAQPSFASPVAYEAVTLAAEALAAGGSPEDMRDALLARERGGIMRVLRFDAHGDLNVVPRTFVVRGGAFVPED